MKKQVIRFKPEEKMSAKEAMNRVARFIPINVQEFLEQADRDGTRSTSLEDTGMEYIVTNWWDQSIIDEYKTLMKEVSPEVKEKLRSEGWQIIFDPETADL